MNNKDLHEEFVKIYDENVDAIFRFCLIRVSDADLAKDITQDTFINAWKYLSSQKEEIKNTKALLYKIAKNLIIDNSRKKKAMSLDEMMEFGFDAPDEDHDRVKEKLDAQQAFQAVNDLEDKYKEVVLMRYVEELSPKEIADVLGESENNVSVRIHRALKQLNKLLKTHEPSSAEYRKEVKTNSTKERR